MSTTESAASPNPVTHFFKRLVEKKRAEPSYPALPEVNDDGESNIGGLYLAGDVAGTPLVKLGLNQGVAVMEKIDAELDKAASDEVLDVVIVGAGPAGLGAALRAKELGRTAVVLEAERLAMTVQNMYEGKEIFAEPHGVDNKSNLWFEECTRETLLEKWEAQVEDEGLDIRTNEKVTNVTRKGDHFVVTSEKDEYKARRVLVAMGKSGNPRKAGVKGESEFADKLHHNLSSPTAFQNQDIFIYGGGDVSCEAAIALATRNKGDDANRITFVTKNDSFVHPKKRNIDRVMQLAEEGKIDLFFNHKLERIEADKVVFKDLDSGEEKTRPNDTVFEMIGAELPHAFFKKAGIRQSGAWTPLRILAVILCFAFVYSLYALKKFPETPYSWPFYLFLSKESFAAVTLGIFEVAFFPFKFLFQADAYAKIKETMWFQQGYLYSLAYTLIMIGFGVEALRRWTRINVGKPEEKRRYQKWRYTSLITFQVAFFLIANVIAVQALSIENAWRAWGIYQPWPLFFNTFHWWDSSDPDVVLWAFVVIGLLGTFVAIPIASHKHGKRFCTWVCGCGGLAETLGDRWRHLAPKGRRSRAWEFQGIVVLLAAILCTVVTVGAFNTQANNTWAMAYSYVVDFWLVAVIPIALYPFFGGKVWCRYWCPLAAYNGLLAKWYGRLKIKSNDKCISCTQCSKYCQVGVDVMAFAKNQEAFDNANSACIQCGICIDVCPMDVLSFDDGPREKTPSKTTTLPIVG